MASFRQVYPGSGLAGTGHYRRRGLFGSSWRTLLPEDVRRSTYNEYLSALLLIRC
ncbi:MAG TPA: hypothetical protein PK261_04360 [Accumulibacter sp.]|nr:hypothetical protein [Accumulibacter sp.]